MSVTKALPKAATGPLAGHAYFPNFSTKRFKEFTDLCVQAGMTYVFGGKPRELTTTGLPVWIDEDGDEVNGCDCSGFMRAAIYYATGGKVIMPDGSLAQYQWCVQMGLKRSTWLSTGVADGVLRLGFHLPDGRDRIGHVWATFGQPYERMIAESFESWGHHGPGNRSWAANPLKRLFSFSFAVAIAP